MTQSGNLTNPDKISSKGQNQKNSLLQKEIQIEGEKERQNDRQRHKFLCCLFVEKLKKETVNTLQQSVHNLISNIKQKLHD